MNGIGITLHFVPFLPMVVWIQATVWSGLRPVLTVAQTRARIRAYVVLNNDSFVKAVRAHWRMFDQNSLQTVSQIFA